MPTNSSACGNCWNKPSRMETNRRESMITALNLNQLARMSTESMLNCMLEGIAIGLFAWILLRVVGRRNSSTRFAVWFFALLAIAALPVLGIAASGLGQTGRAASAITV